jgi:hypothetical protein
MDRGHPFEAKNDFYYSGRSLPFNVAAGCHTKCLGLSYKTFPHSFVILLLDRFYFLKNQQLSYAPKAVCVSVTSMVFSFFLLNTNFYPQLLRYQGGKELAKKIKGNVDPVNVYFWKNNYSSSFNFYTATERKQFDDSIFLKGKTHLAFIR